MTEPSNSALYTALAYHRACTRGGVEQAMSHISPDIVCRAQEWNIHGMTTNDSKGRWITNLSTGLVGR